MVKKGCIGRPIIKSLKKVGTTTYNAKSQITRDKIGRLFNLAAVLCLSIALTSIPGQLLAGDLDIFEQKSRKSTSSDHSSQPSYSSNKRTYSQNARSHDRGPDTLGGAIALGIFHVFFQGMAEITGAVLGKGGEGSWYKAQSTFGSGISESLKERIEGDYLVPFIKLDMAHGELDSDIALKDYQAELGYGPISYVYKTSKFVEDHPKDTLRARQWLFNYRMTFSDRTQIDTGLGKYYLEGNQTRKDPLIHLGATWFMYGPLGASYHYYRTVGNSLKIGDHELALLYTRDYWTIKAAYRKVNGGDADLQGATLGLSFHF